MKHLKQIINQVKSLTAAEIPVTNDLLFQLICYSPKMPARLQQQQLLDEAESIELPVFDKEFSHTELIFKVFKWGSGKRKILLTHGWGSKAADFHELITALRNLDDVQIIAFDAPGNGSSESELSNLILYTKAVKQVMLHYGSPAILIGHSLGAMANVMATQEIGITPALLISLTPLIRLKENFEATMNAAGVHQRSQDHFFEEFEALFGVKAAFFNLTTLYPPDGQVNHWLAYDQADQIAPYPYLADFLTAHPEVNAQAFNGAGHDKIIKTPAVIQEILNRLPSF